MARYRAWFSISILHENIIMRETPKSSKLTRIRDNQRRSRARRKEYLQGLETKLREHEQAGIRASIEIQNAARHVLEENERLRALLRERGVSEFEIVTGLGSDVRIPLDSMLKQKKPCNLHSIGSRGINTPTSISTQTAQRMLIATSRPGILDDTFQPVNRTYKAPNSLRNNIQQANVAMIPQRQPPETAQELLVVNGAFKHEEGQETEMTRTLPIENMDMWHFGGNQQTTAVSEQQVQTPVGHLWQTMKEPNWYPSQAHQFDMLANHASFGVGPS